MKWAIELVPLPVTDVDRAKRFYADQMGFAVDVDSAPAEGFRVVQLTPAGSACSIVFGTGIASSSPGSRSPRSATRTATPGCCSRCPNGIRPYLGRGRRAYSPIPRPTCATDTSTQSCTAARWASLGCDCA